MKRVLLALAVFALGTVFVPVADAHHSAGYHWRRGTNPYTVRLIDNTAPAWRDPVRGASTRWSKKSTVLDLDVNPGSSGGGCAAAANAVRVCSGSFSGTWAGLTEVSYDGARHIVSASVKLDDSSGGAKRAVACHEIGHALGLAHRGAGETSSCMTPSISAAQTKPDRHDLAQLKRIYRHLDGGGAKPVGDIRRERIEVRKRGDITTIRFYTYL